MLLYIYSFLLYAFIYIFIIFGLFVKISKFLKGTDTFSEKIAVQMKIQLLSNSCWISVSGSSRNSLLAKYECHTGSKIQGSLPLNMDIINSETFLTGISATLITVIKKEVN